MSLITVIWTLFRSPGQWKKLDLDGLLGKGDQLFKSLNRFRYLGIENLLQEFSIQGLNMQFLENKVWEITAGTYLTFIVETVNNA